MKTSMAMGLSVKVIPDNKIIEIAPERTERMVRLLNAEDRVPSIVKGRFLKENNQLCHNID